MTKPKLTVKQQKFVDYYIETGNATEAAKRAGYSKKTARAMGSENLSKPYIKDAIEEGLAILKSEAIASQEEVLELLTSIMRGQEKSATLQGVGQGAQTVTNIPPSAQERLKAAELIGKRYGIWTDKQQVDVLGAVSFVDDISEEEEEGMT